MIKHPLNRLVDRFKYVNNDPAKAHIKFFKKDDYIGIEVKIGTRTFKFASFLEEIHAKDHAYIYITDMGIDMMVTDELFKRYQELQNEKLKEEQDGQGS